MLPEGEIADGDVLTLGPVAWFRRAEPEQSGVIRQDGNLTRVSLFFAGSAHAGIEALHRSSEGVITFDPTLSRALLLAEDDETLWQHLVRGGIWVIPIVLFALFASVTAAAKGLWLYRLPAPVPALAERVQSALGRGDEALRALTRAGARAAGGAAPRRARKANSRAARGPLVCGVARAAQSARALARRDRHDGVRSRRCSGCSERCRA